MDAVCCEESHHGSGNCNCDDRYFGEKLGDNALEHYQMSPACDFCPGYDFITGKQNSICSGNKGTCTPSYARIALDGRGGQYQKMRCTCGEEVYIDPITKIVYPDKIIAWSGDLCQCGDWNEDAKCDQCADGFWGPDCKTCPGGAGINQCSRHGKCNAGVDGGRSLQLRCLRRQRMDVGTVCATICHGNCSYQRKRFECYLYRMCSSILGGTNVKNVTEWNKVTAAVAFHYRNCKTYFNRTLLNCTRPTNPSPSVTVAFVTLHAVGVGGATGDARAMVDAAAGPTASSRAIPGTH